MNLVPLLVLLVVVLALVALVIFKKRGRLGGVDGPWPFYAKRPLSSPEQVLYHRLVRALPEHIVLAQSAGFAHPRCQEGFQLPRVE